MSKVCEKNFVDGKVMSLSSTSEDDINEEFIIDDDIEEIVEKPKKKKRTYKSKRKLKTKIKYCKTCGQYILENERRDGFMYKDTYHQLRAKDYCDDHENTYSEHKCKPSWCGDCGYLSKYDITVDWDKKDKRW